MKHVQRACLESAFDEMTEHFAGDVVELVSRTATVSVSQSCSEAALGPESARTARTTFGRVQLSRFRVHTRFSSGKSAHRAKRLSKLREQGRPGGSEQFAWLVTLRQGYGSGPEDFEGGRGRNGVTTVGALHPAGAFDHRSRQHAGRPRRSSATQAPTMSTMESTAPTSWKWTFSGRTPCTLPSATATLRNTAMAFSRTQSLKRLSEISDWIWRKSRDSAGPCS